MAERDWEVYRYHFSVSGSLSIAVGMRGHQERHGYVPKDRAIYFGKIFLTESQHTGVVHYQCAGLRFKDIRSTSWKVLLEEDIPVLIMEHALGRQ